MGFADQTCVPRFEHVSCSMFLFLRRLFAPPDSELRERVAQLERSLAEWEVTMTGLTDKMSSQLKRLATRHGRGGTDEAARQAELNEAIRYRRRSRLTHINGGD